MNLDLSYSPKPKHVLNALEYWWGTTSDFRMEYQEDGEYAMRLSLFDGAYQVRYRIEIVEKSDHVKLTCEVAGEGVLATNAQSRLLERPLGLALQKKIGTGG